MIAKLITYGKDRNEAIDLMKKALADYRLVGFNNNLKFLKRVIGDNVTFRGGDYDTGYIEQNIGTLLKKAEKVDAFDLIAAALIRNYHKSESVKLPRELVNFRTVKGRK